MLRIDLMESLWWWFRDRPEVYVSGDIPVSYRSEGRRRDVRPDLFVVPGIGSQPRDGYRVWDEGRGPDFVIEIVFFPRTTRALDRTLRLYAETLCVHEYVLFDPREEFVEPSFGMFRRSGDGFRAVKPTDGRFASHILGLELERDGSQLRFRDPTTGARVPTAHERLAATETRRAVVAHNARLRGGRNGS